MSLSCSKKETTDSIVSSNSWKFVVVGDTHVTNNSDTIKEMIPYFIQDSIDLILICGDIVEGGRTTTSAELESQLNMWQTIFEPLYDEGIGIYPVRGNHEDDANDDITAWNNVFSDSKALPQNGPSGETNLTYSFNHKNALFIGLDNYVTIHKVNQEWLNEQLSANQQPHVFAFGHEAAFKVFHTDCLDDFATDRNIFWESLKDAGVRAYFCGHDHFFNASLIDDSDGNTGNDIYQCVVGGGGAWLMSKHNYNGINTPYLPVEIYHSKNHGYALVEISGDSSADLNVTITWKVRTINTLNSTAEYIATGNVINYSVSNNR